MRISDSIQALRPDEIELIFSIISFRDLSQKIRNALMMRYEHGYSLQATAVAANVSRRHISNGEKRVLDIHKKIMAHYGHY